MLCLFPVVRLYNKLEKGHTCGDTHHRPVEWDGQCPLDQVVLLALQAGEQIHVDIEEVAKDQRKRTSVEQRPGK